MKIKLLLIALLIFSCSRQEEINECDCNKTTYTYEQEVTIGVGGLPVMTSNKVVLSNEVVGCQEEQTQVSQGNNNYFDIKCN